jgi:hypothetical protein
MTDRNAGDEYLRIGGNIVAVRGGSGLQGRHCPRFQSFTSATRIIAQRLSAGRVNAKPVRGPRVAPLLGRAFGDDEQPVLARRHSGSTSSGRIVAWRNRSVVGRTIRVGSVDYRRRGDGQGLRLPPAGAALDTTRSRRAPCNAGRTGWPRLQRHRSPAEQRHTRDGGRRHREHRASTRDRGSEGA